MTDETVDLSSTIAEADSKLFQVPASTKSQPVRIVEEKDSSVSRMVKSEMGTSAKSNKPKSFDTSSPFKFNKPFEAQPEKIDPYLANTTASQRIIIEGLVKADVDALLERDAVALLHNWDVDITPKDSEVLSPTKVKSAAIEATGSAKPGKQQKPKPLPTTSPKRGQNVKVSDKSPKAKVIPTGVENAMKEGVKISMKTAEKNTSKVKAGGGANVPAVPGPKQKKVPAPTTPSVAPPKAKK